jgi:hypothetical protein
MAVMPGAKFQNVLGAGGERMRDHDVVCIHTIGGPGGPPIASAHFSTDADGRIFQSRDTRFKSEANFEGNGRVIAIENQDTGGPFPKWDREDGHAVPPFTPQQIEANAKICAWAHQEHGILLEPCPDSRPGSRGIAYHRQGNDGNWETYAFGGRVSGGEKWSRKGGKVCPGDARIRQIPQIIKRARVIAGLDAPEVMEDDDMQLIKGDSHPAVFVVVWSHPGTIAVRKRVPNENDPGFQAALAAGYSVRTVPQAVIDAIPEFPEEK